MVCRATNACIAQPDGTGLSKSEGFYWRQLPVKDAQLMLNTPNLQVVHLLMSLRRDLLIEFLT